MKDERPSGSDPLWKNARIYALATGLGALLHIGHVAWAWVLTPEEYGRFANLQVLFNFASSPLTLAPQAFVLAHFHHVARERFAASLGSILLITGALLGLVLWAVPAIPEATLETYGTPRWAVTAVLVAAFLVGPKRMAAGIAEARGRAKETSAWLEVADGLRPVVAVACFLALGLGWEARVVGLVVAQGGAGVLAYALLVRGGMIGRPDPTRAPLGPTLRFAVPAMLATLAYACYDTADRLVVTHYWGLEAAGRYDLAYRIALLTQTVNVVFRRSFTPLFYAAHARGDRVETRRVLARTSRRLLVFTLPLAVVVPVVLTQLPIFDAGYRDAMTIIPVVVLGAALWGIQMLWQQVLLAEGRAQTVLGVTAVGAAVNIGLNLVLVPRYAEMGAAVSTLACFVVMLGLVRWIAGMLLDEDRPRTEPAP